MSSLRRKLVTALMLASLTVALPHCARDVMLDAAPELEAGAAPSLFVPGDEAVERGLTQYCPSSECPPGYTTCPTSLFKCDVNLLTDVKNCGGCDVRCPSTAGENEVYSCIDGRCVIECGASFPRHLNCNGIVDDGCETPVDTNDNCGECGNTCSDPAKPCIDRTLSNEYGCGCPDGKLICNYLGSHICQDIQNNDAHCGACDNACDPTGGGRTPPDHAYYGCKNESCGVLKCTKGFGDCDRNVLANGCETNLLTDQNCGACGNECPPDQFCALQPLPPLGVDFLITCVCPQGLSFCGRRGSGPEDPSMGACFDLTSDPQHCGACDVVCPGTNNSWLHALASCEYGICKQTCMQGWSDCNGNLEDDCETNTASDPKNCGGCGVVCDAVIGQACIQGRCVMVPCEQDGGATR